MGETIATDKKTFSKIMERLDDTVDSNISDILNDLDGDSSEDDDSEEDSAMGQKHSVKNKNENIKEKLIKEDLKEVNKETQEEKIKIISSEEITEIPNLNNPTDLENDEVFPNKKHVSCVRTSTCNESELNNNLNIEIKSGNLLNEENVVKGDNSSEVCDVGVTVEDNNDVDSESELINKFLDSSAGDAEARLLARRAARAEAREIRMRDLERQQREQEENADRQFDMNADPIIRRPTNNTSRYLSSRRSSEDSLEDTGSIRDLRHELKEVEEKFRKAMIANAQLDNDKAAQTYKLEVLKDRLEELEEDHSQLKREHRDKCREFEQLKRLTVKLKEDLAVVKSELEDRDRLIAEKGLVIVGEEETSGENGPPRIKRALVSAENAQFLENAGEGSLDVRLAKFAKERGELQDQISHLKLELEDERNRRRKHSGGMLNGPNYDSDHDAADVQREANKQSSEYKFRAQKAEQDVATLQATVARLESQVIRYKSAAEISEKAEEALKAERRKLQREAREAQNRAEELEVSNTHLIKRLDKLKNAKSALLKDL